MVVNAHRNTYPSEEWLADEQAAMLAQIEAGARATAAYTGRPAFSPRVMAAMARVPRHEFVPLSERSLAYADAALPIAHGQTISQPYIVALMTDLLDLTDGSVVLEVGTGCGYQTAVLAEVAKQVYSIEVIPALAREAQVRLSAMGFTNIEICSDDGYHGWPEHAPFDGIMVTAATAEIPPPLSEQLKRGGRMVIPLGRPYMGQELTVVVKSLAGEVRSRPVLPVAFVPFVRKQRSEEEQ
jgi:protein-L-isoaspartate(D-aspartate) O-methyltransferase